MASLEPAEIPDGAQGAEDVLTVALGSGGAATVALLALRDWIGSTTTKLRVTVGDRSVELESKHADLVIPQISTLLKELADGDRDSGGDAAHDQPALTNGEPDHGGR